MEPSLIAGHFGRMKEIFAQKRPRHKFKLVVVADQTNQVQQFRTISHVMVYNCKKRIPDDHAVEPIDLPGSQRASLAQRDDLSAFLLLN